MTFQTLHAVVERNNFVVLDTETTGLDSDAQACQIAVIDQTGNILINTLVKPTILIPADATAIHGITNEMVANAPGMAQVAEQLLSAIRGLDVIIYNASYDIGVISHSIRVTRDMEAYARWLVWWGDETELVCAMETYARYWGEWNEFHHSFTWQRLSTACRQQSLPVVNAHNALGDCQMTLALVRKICANPDDAMPERDWLSEE